MPWIPIQGNRKIIGYGEGVFGEGSWGEQTTGDTFLELSNNPSSTYLNVKPVSGFYEEEN